MSEDVEAVIAELRAAESQLAFLAEGCGVPGLDHIPIVSRANAEYFAKDVRLVLTALDAARRRVGMLEGEAGLIAIDQAFIDGAKAGYRFGVTEDMDGLEAFLAIRRSEISAAFRGAEHAD